MNRLASAAILAKWKLEETQALLCAESGKKKYPTLAEAESRRDELSHRTGTRGAVYWCRHCGSFHMTRQRPKLGDKSTFLKGATDEAMGRFKPASPRR